MAGSPPFPIKTWSRTRINRRQQDSSQLFANFLRIWRELRAASADATDNGDKAQQGASFENKEARHRYVTLLSTACSTVNGLSR